MSPGVVLLGGSGPAPRESVAAYAVQLQELGVATLAVDKRGSGRSGGDWTDASLDDLAGDAAAALRWLRSQPGIDPHRVGVWGVSQAGWVIPRLIDQPTHPAFCIIVTGGGESPQAVELFGYRQAMATGHVADADRQQAEALLAQYFDWLGTGRDRAGLVAAIEHARGQSWYHFLNLDRVLPSDAARSRWAWVATYDPLVDIRHMTMPTIVVLGAGDPLGPAAASAAGWREGLKASGNPAGMVEVFDDMGHAGRQGAGHDPGNPLSPSYRQAIARFVGLYVIR